ncbi:MAG: cytochrome c-type biogenesis protein CcmH [Betaproteobacteria bacterium]|jgi:cytochrome c-type biogenesis protein CcmH|nr:cytochrome c-type biogenesis protein CcmH [Betaproteobacteria bacterium]
MLRMLVLVAGLACTQGALAQGAPTAAAAAPGTPAASDAPAPTPAPSSGVARPNAEDPALERRLQAVTKELRCMVCQNESIADSHAPLAVDMRNEIREQLKSGMSDRDVIEFMVARYGNFVRFRPPLDWTTYALWFGPALLMVIGFGVLLSQLRQRRNLVAARAMPELTAADRAALDALAAGSPNDKTGNR